MINAADLPAVRAPAVPDTRDSQNAILDAKTAQLGVAGTTKKNYPSKKLKIKDGKYIVEDS